MNRTLPQPQAAEVQFVSIILYYGDSTVAAVGPQDFDEIYRNPDSQKESFCHCIENYTNKGYTGFRLPFKLHYKFEDWVVVGKISEVRIWSSIYLDGVQFVKKGGHESPPFGNCGGEPTKITIFGPEQAVNLLSPAFSKQGRRVANPSQTGLKTFMDSNSRTVYELSDTIILGLQAMGTLSGESEGATGSAVSKGKSRGGKGSFGGGRGRVS